MTRVLFLDMDGVVLSGNELWRTKNNRYIPPDKVSLINEVCAKTGAVLVVSSTWRQMDGCLELLKHGGLGPFHPDWRTAKNTKVGNIWVGCSRGREIQDWLDAHPEIESYAIVDDDHDMLEEQMDRFVQTSFREGISREDANRLIGILNSPAPVVLMDNLR